ncbi:MAG: DUF302 domain-containing protein [Gammaproteobacteria bacterium]|nr:DUF302 domain-containing protein [Gammaproteobacteria bacterium]MDH5659684.1 DUF302 domain-containing protein [Gammaproteobacteria bacterium]
MKHLLVLFSLFILSPAISLASDNGMINKKSQFSVKVTLDRLENVLRKKGITIVTRWSHHGGAKKVGIPLRPTELLIFGNPKMGSHFFTSKQTAGIDLPMKALAWKDKKGQVWLTYNDPAYIANRHAINDRPEIEKKMTFALNNLTNVATGNK